MGPTWVLSAPNGSHVGPRNLAIRVIVDAGPYIGGFINSSERVYAIIYLSNNFQWFLRRTSFIKMTRWICWWQEIVLLSTFRKWFMSYVDAFIFSRLIISSDISFKYGRSIIKIFKSGQTFSHWSMFVIHDVTQTPLLGNLICRVCYVCVCCGCNTGECFYCEPMNNYM